VSFPVLHALTNDVVLADPGFISSATAAMRACRSRLAIHLRAAELTPYKLLDLALELRVVAEETGSWVLVTDRVDIAMAAGVTGAQLTSRSITIADARRIAPRLTLGASVHESADAWLTAQSGASFIVAGLSSTSDRHSDLPAFVRTVVDAAGICPVVAVGGVTLDRVHLMTRAGAAGIAVMRGIWLDDTALAARRYLAAYDEGFRD
jgi:thiamine-phosphate diphosphorylase